MLILVTAFQVIEQDPVKEGKKRQKRILYLIPVLTCETEMPHFRASSSLASSLG